MLGHLATLAGSAVFGLAGCQRKKPGAPLLLWHACSEEQLIAYHATLRRFSRRHPEILITTKHILPRNMRTTILDAVRSRSLPDVFMVRSAWLEACNTGQQLHDLGALAGRESPALAQRIMPHDLARCRRGGQLLALPSTTSSGQATLFANLGVLENAGLTPTRGPDWAAFTEHSRELVARLNPRGEPLRILALHPFLSAAIPLFICLVYGRGQKVISDDGARSLLFSPACIETSLALDHYIETVYGTWGGYRALLGWNLENGIPSLMSVTPFVSGRIAYMLSASWFYGMCARTPEKLRFETALLPGFNGLQSGVASDGWAYAMSRRAADNPAAWQLLRFLSIDPDGNGQYCIDLGRLCPILSVNESPPLSSMHNAMQRSIELDYHSPAPLHEDFLLRLFDDLPLRRIAGESMTDILRDIDRLYQQHIDVLRESQGTSKEVEAETRRRGSAGRA